MARKLQIVFLSILAIVISYELIGVATIGGATYYLANIFFSETVTPEGLIAKHKKTGSGILVVPGHDKNNYGTQYRGVTEASLNAELGGYLFEYFRNDPKFIAFITHKSTGELNGWISDYIKKEDTAINAFREKTKFSFLDALRIGAVKRETQVHHNSATNDTAKTLYGINKWANDNNIDIVLHLHFNDYPGRKYESIGKYKGFSIYIPDNQLPNHRASMGIAQSVRRELRKVEPESNFPREKDIVIEDQELIAIGSNASRTGVSILIEYGYIYESKLTNKNTRSAFLQQLAYQTYLGVKSFFEKN